MRVRKFTALAAGAALLMAPAVALAEEGDDSVDDRTTDRRGQEVVDIARDAVEGLSEETGIPAEVLLDMEFEFDLPGDGEDGPVKVTIEEAVLRVAGRTVVDTNNNSGFAGTPWTSAGNILHVYTNILAGAHGLLTVEQAENTGVQRNREIGQITQNPIKQRKQQATQAALRPAMPLGNHDLLVQGETPPTERIDAVAHRHERDGGPRVACGPHRRRPRR
jgi:hypothetical protein